MKTNALLAVAALSAAMTGCQSLTPEFGTSQGLPAPPLYAEHPALMRSVGPPETSRTAASLVAYGDAGPCQDGMCAAGERPISSMPVGSAVSPRCGNGHECPGQKHHAGCRGGCTSSFAGRCTGRGGCGGCRLQEQKSRLNLRQLLLGDETVANGCSCGCSCGCGGHGGCGGGHCGCGGSRGGGWAGGENERWNASGGGRMPVADRSVQMAAGVRHAMGVHPFVAHAQAAAQQRCANGIYGRPPGPEYGAVTYPYYTTRGPRDFFMASPPSIGP